MSRNIDQYTEDDFLKAKEKLLFELTLKPGLSTHKNPKAYLLGGQPGSGKSAISVIYDTKHQGDLIIINVDDYRSLHPNFKEINSMYGPEAAFHTNEFAKRLKYEVIEELSNRKYNLLIEGTLRTTTGPLKLNKLLKTKGYTTELSVIATKPEISYLGVKLRYEGMLALGKEPRDTPKAFHDSIVENICDNLKEIYETKEMNTITIYNRDKLCLYDFNTTPHVEPSKILKNEFNRPFTKEEIDSTLLQLKNLSERIRHNYKNGLLANKLEEFKNYSAEMNQSISSNKNISDKIRKLKNKEKEINVKHTQIEKLR